MTYEEQRKAIHSAIEAGAIPAPEIVSWVMKYNSSKRTKKLSKKKLKEIATKASHSTKRFKAKNINKVMVECK